MKKVAVSGLALALVLVLASGLQAQGIYIGVQAGYSAEKPKLPDDLNSVFESDASFFYGGRLGLKMMMFAVEANYLRAGHELVQTVVGDVNWDGIELTYQYIGVNAKLFPLSLPIPPVASIRPFLTAGYGVYTADLKEVDKDSKGSYNAGLGLELKISKIALLVEGKYRKGKVTIEGRELELGNFSISGGVNIYF